MRIGIEGIPNFDYLSCFAILKIEKKLNFWIYKNGFIGKKVCSSPEDILFLT